MACIVLTMSEQSSLLGEVDPIHPTRATKGGGELKTKEETFYVV